MNVSTNQELLMFAHCRMNKTASIEKEAFIYNAVRKIQGRMARNPAAQPVLKNVSHGARTVSKNPVAEQAQQIAREFGGTAPTGAEKAIVNSQLATGAVASNPKPFLNAAKEGLDDAAFGLKHDAKGMYDDAGHLFLEGQVGLGTNVSQIGRRMANNPKAGGFKKWVGGKVDEMGDGVTRGHYTGTPPPAVGAMANTVGPMAPAVSAMVGVPAFVTQFAAEKAGLGAQMATPYVRDGAKAVGRAAKEQAQMARIRRAIAAEQRAAAQAAQRTESSLVPEARRMILDQSDPLLNRKLSPNIRF